MATFSVIIPTRNRPALFQNALRSVLDQSCSSTEIIVINDGSDDVYLSEYKQIVESAGRPIQFHGLIQRPNGHGSSYAINCGASFASADHLCFLDDDDFWTDKDYLARVQLKLESDPESPPLIFSNQVALFNGQRQDGPIWLEGLAARLDLCAQSGSEERFYEVSVEDVLNTQRFCHLNTMIVRKALYDEIGGMDESIRWENDRDLFLRLIDKANRIWLSPRFVSQHNIPDRTKSINMTTSLNEVQRRLQQLRVFEKASLLANHSAIRTYGRQHQSYTLKRIAETCASTKHYRTAAHFARTALSAQPTLKWAAFTLFLTLRSLARGTHRTEAA